jgi:hypothetical protein
MIEAFVVPYLNTNIARKSTFTCVVPEYIVLPHNPGTGCSNFTSRLTAIYKAY